MSMNQTIPSFPSAILMTLLGGATLGGFAVALSTTETGRKLRNRILALAGRVEPDESTDEPVLAVFI
jgi:hypothetical protein